MKKLLLLLAVFVSLQASAQEEYDFSQAWYISGGAGTASFLGDVAPLPTLELNWDYTNYDFAYMFRLGKKIVPAFDMNVEYMKGNLSGGKPLDAAGNTYDRSFTGDFYSVTINARLDPLKLIDKTRDFPFSFFGRVGVGPMYYRAIVTRRSDGTFLGSTGYLDEGKTLNKRSQATVVPYGFGLCYDFCGKNLRLEAAVDLYNAFTDNLDAKTGITEYDDKFFTVTGSVVYGFDWNKWQAPKFRCDADRDRVKDKKDKCPATPAGVKVDEYGCAPDADKDGIADYLDKCPNQNGLAKFNGCPDTDGDGIQDSEDKCPAVAGITAFAGCPDTDGDGIQDSEDKCPVVAGISMFDGCPDTDGDGIQDSEDKCPAVAGSVALKGCPDKDNDGVADFEDKCPNVPGIKANKGCPEVKKETIEIFKQALTGIKFETGKDVIKPVSFVILDKVVKVMNDNPEYQLDINGHTDNVGDDAQNLILSQKRAKAVMKYLNDKGIAANRMAATGYGETQPKADNNTPEGRTENRRVEFKVNF